LGENMITQSKKISKNELEAIRGLVMLFQRIYEPKYDHVLYEFKILKMPIFGEIEGEQKKIGEEVVYGVIHYHEFGNALYFEIHHQSYFD